MMLCQDVRAQDAVRMAPAGSGMATLSPSRQQVRRRCGLLQLVSGHSASSRTCASQLLTIQTLANMALAGYTAIERGECAAEV